MKKSRILCVANWDSDVGYAWWLMESFWVRIAEHYVDRHKVILVYPSVSKIPDSIKSSYLKIFEEDFRFSSKLSILKQMAFILRNKIKYIYFSDRVNKNWRYALYRLVGVKVIFSHDYTPGNRTRPSLIKKIFKSMINRIPYITTDVSIGATEFIKQRLINVNCIPEKYCYTAPNGIPAISNIRTVNINSIFNIPENHKVIVLIGRANLYKGFDFALEVSRFLIENFKNNKMHFLFLGDGPALKYLKNMAITLGVDNNVTFAGRVSDVDSILRGCSVAFNPSKGEVGYSLSVLECMRAHLPIVVSDNLSVCGATEDGVDGVIYKQNDINSAANALHKLLIDTELAKKMGDAGAKKVATIFSHEICLQKLMEILDRAIQ